MAHEYVSLRKEQGGSEVRIRKINIARLDQYLFAVLITVALLLLSPKLFLLVSGETSLAISIHPGMLFFLMGCMYILSAYFSRMNDMRLEETIAVTYIIISFGFTFIILGGWPLRVLGIVLTFFHAIELTFLLQLSNHTHAVSNEENPRLIYIVKRSAVILLLLFLIIPAL